jgi:RNA polymerase sigma-70 factor (ECF subfamily)
MLQQAGNRINESSELAEALTRLLPRLWTFALRLMGDAKLAEDLVRRTCCEALERKVDMPVAIDPGLWLLTVLHSVWQSNFRKLAIRNSMASVQLSDTPGMNGQEHMHCRIISGVMQLPDVQRFAILLVTAEDIGVKNASEILGITVGTTMDLILQARLTIGSCFYVVKG